MYVTQDIADRIKWRLKEKGIRTKDMLSDLNMGINAISEFAKGKQMSCIALARIADYLDCSVDYLLGRTDNPAVNYDVTDGLVAAVGEQDGQLVTVSDTCLTYASPAGEVRATYSYAGSYLREYDLHGDGFTALLLNRYKSGGVGRLVTVDTDGQEIAALDVNEEILSISAAGRYLAVLYMDSVVIYTEELEIYAQLEGTDYARSVLMRQDGSALLLAAESAHLFLP